MTNQDDKNFEDNIVSTANNVIKSEIEALNNIKSSIDDNFIVAVKMLLELGKDSKVIVSGIGKAGFICNSCKYWCSFFFSSSCRSNSWRPRAI